MTRRIRLATSDDASQIQAIYAPSCALETHVSFEIGAPTVAELERRIDQLLPRYPWLVCEEDDKILGYAYASSHSERAAYLWSVTTAIYIRADQVRSGVGFALYKSLLAILRLQGFASAYAGISMPNPGSVGLHRAVGFALVGEYRDVGFKNGRWMNSTWWQVSLGGRMTDPSPPASLDQIETTPAFTAALAAGLFRP